MKLHYINTEQDKMGPNYIVEHQT